MARYCVLYHSLAHHKKGLENAKKVEKKLPGASFEYVDSTTIGNLCEFIDALPEDQELIFTGGDGTINHVINELGDYELKRPLYYFPAGTGNDFINDLHKTTDCEPFPINESIRHLPVVTVHGKKYRTINGVSLGLDGFCCEEKDRLSALGIDRSYVLIALQALVYKYHTTNARVTVDGVTKTYDRVWIAPTMFGSYYGGGVLIAPSQKRDNPEHLVTCQILHGCSRFIGTTIFLAVTKGHSDRFPKFVDIRPGRHVVVEFDRPAALQIDGEVISGVTRYEVDAGL